MGCGTQPSDRIPAEAGIPGQEVTALLRETPAFAGMTACGGRQSNRLETEDSSAMRRIASASKGAMVSRRILGLASAAS
jgi:hypothetical protein